MLVISLAGGILYWLNITSSPGALSVYEEDCGIAYISPSMPNGGSVCGLLGRVAMPDQFNLSTIIRNASGNATTLHDVYFGVYLQEGHAIKISMNSSVPVRFRIYFDNQSIQPARAIGNEALNSGRLITNETGIASYVNRILAQKNGVYIFELFVNKPTSIPSVSFDIQANDLLP